MKSIQKSIRMTNKVYDYVNAQNGTGFNEKFENMVLHCMEREAELDRNIKSFESRIKILDKEIGKRSAILSKLNQISGYIDYAVRYCNSSELTGAGNLEVK